MKRFVIKEIISQDKKGIVFLAQDTRTNLWVELKRFFPYGANGGGMSKEESAAYLEAADTLLSYSFPSFRSILDAGIDPIDSIPYLVSEWREGRSLNEVLTEGKFEPHQANEVIRRALETSQFLSPLIGEQGVWIDTELDSVSVTEVEQSRSYLFCISPTKWLGAEVTTCRLNVLADLGEKLMGWNGKLYSDQAGNGFGACLKWFRSNPCANLDQALSRLEECSGMDDDIPVPQNRTKIIAPAPLVSSPKTMIHRERSVVLTQDSTSMQKVWIILTLVALLMGVAGYWIFKRDQLLAESGKVEEKTAEVSAARSAPETILAEKKSQVSPVIPEPAQEKRRLESPSSSVVVDSSGDELPLVETLSVVEPSPQEELSELSPDDSDAIHRLAHFAGAAIKGMVKKIRKSSTGKSIYLEFSDPIDKDQIHVVVHESSYDGKYDTAEFDKYMGKNVRFRGEVFREITGRQYVRIRSPENIEIIP